MPKKNKFNGSINKPFVPEKKKDDKKARNVAIVLLLVLAFCCFGSVLAIGLTVKDCITASAEEIVSEAVPVPEGYPNLIHLMVLLIPILINCAIYVLFFMLPPIFSFYLIIKTAVKSCRF